MGLIAASSLLVDYILTVAVSVSDGVGQAGSALSNAGSFFNSLRPHAVLFCVLIVLVIIFQKRIVAGLTAGAVKG